MGRTGLCAVVLMTALAVPAVAIGEEPGDEPSPQAPQGERPDFLFSTPDMSIGVRGTFTLGRANSDWYEFVTDQLTLDRNDFRSSGIAADLGLALTPKLDFVIGADYGSVSADSEFRHFEELVNGLRFPIRQTTRLRQAAFTGGLRLALTERGRSVSSLAWIPRRAVPYVGAGGGVMWYNVKQFGDFVDFQDSSIFTDALESNGWGPTAYVNGGVDLNLVRHVYLTVDARYHWAAAGLHTPWDGFERLDLTGLRLSTGLNVAF